MFILYIIHPAALNYLELRPISIVTLIFTETSISTLPVIILGDFNIHYNNVHKSIKLRQLLDSFDMNQHEAGATHKQGNILDLEITPNHDNRIKSVPVCDYNISDHYSVECNMDLLVSHPKARLL